MSSVEPHDLFISYCHLDNRPPGDSQQGWVTQFHQDVATRLGQLLGRQVRIWRDEKPWGTDDPSDGTEEAVRSSRAFVCIISPQYLDSVSCRRELLFIGRQARVVGASKSNLFYVLKSPVDRARVPDLRRFVGYEFFFQDPVSGQVAELYPSRTNQTDERRQAFWQRFSDLAGDIAPVLDSGEAAKPTITPGAALTSIDRQTLFLCYRREDTEDAAGRLHDRLTATFGQDRVFMDIDSVPLGIDFVDHVTEQIAKCSAVIVMIGKQWLTIKDKKRRRRLDFEDDLVRAEIRAALQQKIPVIPVTVQNAALPHADDLPDDIRPLVRRNGIELSATRWSTDVERLIKELERVLK